MRSSPSPFDPFLNAVAFVRSKCRLPLTASDHGVGNNQQIPPCQTLGSDGLLIGNDLIAVAADQVRQRFVPARCSVEIGMCFIEQNLGMLVHIRRMLDGGIKVRIGSLTAASIAVFVKALPGAGVS